MKRIGYLAGLLMFLCACATTNGVNVIKKMKEDKSCRNVVAVDVNKSVADSKVLVRQVATEMGFIEKNREETPKFIYCEDKFMGEFRKSFSGRKANYYGFFFEPNSMDTVTTITIVEDTIPDATPKRDAIAARIKELTK